MKTHNSKIDTDVYNSLPPSIKKEIAAAQQRQQQRSTKDSRQRQQAVVIAPPVQKRRKIKHIVTVGGVGPLDRLHDIPCTPADVDRTVFRALPLGISFSTHRPDVI